MKYILARVALAMCLITILAAFGTIIYVEVSTKDLVPITEPTTYTTEDELICQDEWFVTDEKPSQFTDETYPPGHPANPTESETVPETTEYVEEVTEPVPMYFMSEEDMKLFATLLYLESGNQSDECLLATGSVVLNRMVTYHRDMRGTVYARNERGNYEFSVAPRIAYSNYDERCMDIAVHLIMNGPTVPKCVQFFRTSYYHNWDIVDPYEKIDEVYFSHDIRYCHEEGGCSYVEER